MQRAGHQRPVAVRATSASPPGAKGATAIALRLVGENLPTSKPETETVCDDESAHRGAAQRALEIAIQQRIESRLGGRVRNLSVRAFGDVVILEGDCATYYTKQLAQHAAMGILDDEHLENAIVVSVPQ
jgi:hypothetical protein